MVMAQNSFFKVELDLDETPAGTVC